MLFKVQISTELMVVAENQRDAIEIAKANAANEVATYGKGTATTINKASELPEDWKNVIPYSKDAKESKKCSELVFGAEVIKEVVKELPVSLPQDDIEELMRIKNSVKNQTVAQQFTEVKPESRPDPKPKEQDWHDIKSGRPMKQLRFVR